MDIPVYLDLEDDYLPSLNNNNKMAFDPLLPQSPRTGEKFKISVFFVRFH